MVLVLQILQPSVRHLRFPLGPLINLHSLWFMLRQIENYKALLLLGVCERSPHSIHCYNELNFASTISFACSYMCLLEWTTASLSQ